MIRGRINLERGDDVTPTACHCYCYVLRLTVCDGDLELYSSWTLMGGLLLVLTLEFASDEAIVVRIGRCAAQLAERAD